eukprot:COSAG06_NODE_36992_length_440_cov_1.736070_2_plen_41_part_01
MTHKVDSCSRAVERYVMVQLCLCAHALEEEATPAGQDRTGQ